jgi:ABC-type branched-subunit amino acid transport system substrate-binding protein
VADIRIEAKKPPLWPWAAGLIGLVVLAWAAYALLGRGTPGEPLTAGVSDPETAVRALQQGGTAGVPAAVRTYVQNCSAREADAMGLDHDHTSQCVRQLADGIEAVVQQRNLGAVQVQPQLQQARQSADRLAASGPEAEDHSAMARDAFQAIAQAIEQIQNAHYPQLDGQAAQLQQSAAQVQPGASLLDQREHVQRFFQQAGEALNVMAATAPGAA